MYNVTDIGVKFNDHPVDVCRFMNSLISDRCTREIEYDYSMKQPEWVECKKELGTITSFTSFKDQTAILSLVCTHFRTASLLCLKETLKQPNTISIGDNTQFVESNAIIFCSYGSPWGSASDDVGGYLLVTARNGWSQKHISKESTLDDAMWLYSAMRVAVGKKLVVALVETNRGPLSVEMAITEWNSI